MAHGAALIYPILFTKYILAGEPINVFNDGKMQLDLTYIGDIVEGCCGVATN